MARALRRPRVAALALPAIVGCSTLVHWLAGRRLDGLWIMPDEAIYAQRAYTFWHHGSLPLFGGQGAGYGVLYPMLIGLPLSIGSFVHGYAWLKVLQALVVSLVAVPVYVYGRRLMPRGYALIAAALAVASPLLLYSGLVMTEVLFYPLATLALLAIAKAVETGTRRDQLLALALVGLAILTRVQAVVLVAVFACAVVVDALLARDRARIRRFWPVALVLVGCALAALAVPGLFGSYAGTLRGSYPVGLALGMTFDHLSYLVLSVGIVPALALLLLLARPPADAGGRALVTVAAVAIVLVVMQVGFFAARYSPHLLGRDLASLPPVLFLTLALWLARGAPRGLVLATLCAFALLCVLLLAPWGHLASATALPDSFGLAPLIRLPSPVTVVTVVALVLLASGVALPRRLTLALPALVLALLVAASVVASNQIAAADSAEQASIVGSPATWIDRAAPGPVTYVYDGEAYWNTVWQEEFWNRHLNRVVSIDPSTVPGPIPQTHVALPESGLLPGSERYVVASNRLTFFGTPVASLVQTGLDVSGLTLWRLDGPPRVSTIEYDVLPNGDMTGPATVAVYDCGPGSLQLTLLPKATSQLQIFFDGVPVLTANLSGLSVWHGSIPSRPSATPGICRYTIAGGTLLGSTRIAYVRDSP